MVFWDGPKEKFILPSDSDAKGEYGNWNYAYDILCSNNMVSVQSILKVLDEIFPSLVEESKTNFCILNRMSKVNPPSKTNRFPDNGDYVMLGNPFCVEKMNAIHASLKMIKKIDQKSNTDAAELTLMKNSLESLKETLKEFRQHISNGDCVFDRKSFEQSYMIVWNETSVMKQ